MKKIRRIKRVLHQYYHYYGHICTFLSNIFFTSKDLVLFINQDTCRNETKILAWYLSGNVNDMRRARILTSIFLSLSSFLFRQTALWYFYPHKIICKLKFLYFHAGKCDVFFSLSIFFCQLDSSFPNKFTLVFQRAIAKCALFVNENIYWTK